MAKDSSLPIKILPLVGAIAIVLSVIQPWIAGIGSVHADELPVNYVLTGDIGASTFSLAVLLLVVAAAGAILFSLDRWTILRRICGGAVMLLVVLFLAQLFSSGVGDDAGLRVTVDLIGVGPYFAFVGGALLAAG
ncbi:MAG: hypothetical protein WD757_08945 [Actinomycetota bacterium]